MVHSNRGGVTEEEPGGTEDGQSVGAHSHESCRRNLPSLLLWAACMRFSQTTAQRFDGPSGLPSCSLAKGQRVGVPGLLLKARRQRKGLPQQGRPITDAMCDRVGRSAK